VNPVITSAIPKLENPASGQLGEADEALARHGGG